MNPCLEYFESVLSDPDKAMPWDAWWKLHHEDVKANFTQREYLELKFKKTEAANRMFHQTYWLLHRSKAGPFCRRV